MTLDLSTAERADDEPPKTPRRLLKGLQKVVGLVLLVVGAPLALLPLHLGIPLVILGLIMVLRSSMTARRRFIEHQRKRPRLLFPVRRLMRREPEVFPVAWQQVLRMERMILPPRWRLAKSLRRRLMKNPG